MTSTENLLRDDAARALDLVETALSFLRRSGRCDTTIVTEVDNLATILADYEASVR